MPQRRERREFRESTSLSERYRFWLQPLAIAVAPAVNLIFVAFVAFCVDWGFKYQSIATGVFFNLLLVHGIVVAFSMALIAVGNARLATPDYRYTLGISALSAFVAILATPFFLREPSFGAILVSGLCVLFSGSIIVITPFAAVSYFIATFFKSGKRLLTASEFSDPAP